MTVCYTRVMECEKLLTNTTKMPCDSISLDAKLCRTGSKLAKSEWTPCYDCYALAGNYLFPSVKNKQQRVLDFMNSDDFVEVMVCLLETRTYFRWFDSGDIQSQKMANDILDICERTPHCQHWLPSKEYKDWRQVLSKRKLPDNLCLRLSNPYANFPPQKEFTHTSTTYTDEKFVFGFMCPAHLHKEKYGVYSCRNCRACWDSNIPNISYIHRNKKKKRSEPNAKVKYCNVAISN